MFDLGSWRLIGVNAQLFGSALESETTQEAWLHAALAGAADRQVALFLHKPLCPGMLAIDFAGDQPSIELVRPAGMAELDLATIKGHGRYKFLRDMPACPPQTA